MILLFLNMDLPWEICQKYGTVWILMGITTSNAQICHFFYTSSKEGVAGCQDGTVLISRSTKPNNMLV